MPRFVVAGTDTDIGKTVFAAALTRAIGASYWKPVQAGLNGPTDSERVRELGVGRDRVIPEAYRLRTPCSPHQAAAIDGVVIERARLALPTTAGNLVIEGAGGVLVPLTDDLLFAGLFANWQVPVILVASTRLGTINHSLLSLDALRSRSVPVRGIAFVGAAMEESEDAICRIGKVARLGRLPILPHLDADSLEQAFAENFDLEAFQ